MKPTDSEVSALLLALAKGTPLDRAALVAGIKTREAQAWLEQTAQRLSPKEKVYEINDTPIVGEGTQKVIAYVDGGARGNPGPSGCGAAICASSGQVLAKRSKFLGHGTNNEAEYQGLILALKTAKEMKVQDLEVRADSNLMVQQMNGRYKVKAKNLIPLFIEAKNLAKQFARFRISHVGRGDNQVADGLANEAMDQGSAGNA